jgi:hypothetical protein
MALRESDRVLQIYTCAPARGFVACVDLEERAGAAVPAEALQFVAGSPIAWAAP